MRYCSECTYWSGTNCTKTRMVDTPVKQESRIVNHMQANKDNDCPFYESSIAERATTATDRSRDYERGQVDEYSKD